MRSPDEIRDLSFHKSVNGYKVTDVEDFLEEVASQIEQLISKEQDIQNKYAELNKKFTELQISQTGLQNVMINAQRVADQIIDEANQKAEQIVSQAKERAEKVKTDSDLLVAEADGKLQNLKVAADTEVKSLLEASSKKAEAMIKAAKDSVERQQMLFDRLRLEAIRIKKEMSDTYKERLEALEAIPVEVPFDATRAAKVMAAKLDSEPDFDSFSATDESPVEESASESQDYKDEQKTDTPEV
ncbi:MAG: DivIVA domain-containing protein [bacterium]|nr:DivIVA domain-containing protein [bacterium]